MKLRNGSWGLRKLIVNLLDTWPLKMPVPPEGRIVAVTRPLQIIPGFVQMLTQLPTMQHWLSARQKTGACFNCKQPSHFQKGRSAPKMDGRPHPLCPRCKRGKHWPRSAGQKLMTRETHPGKGPRGSNGIKPWGCRVCPPLSNPPGVAALTRQGNNRKCRVDLCALPLGVSP